MVTMNFRGRTYRAATPQGLRAVLTAIAIMSGYLVFAGIGEHLTK